MDSIARRRLLVDLLKIPPALLGLASLPGLQESLASSENALQSRVSLAESNRIKLYQDAFAVYSQMHLVRTAQDALPEIEGWIARIQDEIDTSTTPSRELLLAKWRLHALCAKIYGEDACSWLEASEHLNASLELATAVQSADLQAASLYRSSAVHVAQKNLALAKTELDGALLYANGAQSHIRGAVFVDAALVHASLATDGASVTSAQRLLDQAEKYTDRPFDDGVMNFSAGKYQLIKARTLLALNRPGKALECLDDAEADISQKERRRLAILTIFQAECYIKMKRPEYDTALLLLMDALTTSREIKSTFNIKHIQRLYRMLHASNYGTSPQVADLALRLRELR